MEHSAFEGALGGVSFADGSASELTSFLTSKLSDSREGVLGRRGAALMIGAAMSSLAYMRDSGEILLNENLIRSFFSFDMLVCLERRRDFPVDVRRQVCAYLSSLPGGLGSSPLGSPSAAALAKHGLFEKQVAKVLASEGGIHG